VRVFDAYPEGGSSPDRNSGYHHQNHAAEADQFDRSQNEGELEKPLRLLFDVSDSHGVGPEGSACQPGCAGQ
jgi:hypothetical protein